MRFIRRFILFLLAIFSFQAEAYSQDRPEYLDQRQLVESFCKADFEWDTGFRYDLTACWVKPSNPKNDRMYFQLLNDPVVVVSSYKVLEVRSDGKTANATVAFHQLAKTAEKLDGEYYRVLVRDEKKEAVVRYQLAHDGKRWWVVDPPAPRISKQALMRYLASFRERFRKLNDDDQCKHIPVYSATGRDLKLLQSLP